jgi:uncharacterized tellurite resistance protein B-like protein
MRTRPAGGGAAVPRWLMHEASTTGLAVAQAAIQANDRPNTGIHMASGLLAQIRELFEGDAGVRKVADDPVLSAELLLLFRMILADGQVSETEMAVFKRICRDSFGIGEESMDGVIEYLHDFGYETTGTQAIDMFRGLDIERRKELARHMAEIAKADSQLAENEVRLLRRTLEVLGISPVDLVKPAGEG